MKAKKLAKILWEINNVTKSRDDESTLKVDVLHRTLVQTTEIVGGTDEIRLVWFFNIVGDEIIFWEAGKTKEKTAISCKDMKRLCKIMRCIKRV